MTDTTQPRPIYFPFDEERDENAEGEQSTYIDDGLEFDEDGVALPNRDRPTPVTG